MKAIIIAAGRGSRIRKISINKPKCFIKIKNNISILDRQIFFLKKNNIKKIFIVTGHKSNFFSSKRYNCIKNKKYLSNEQADSLMYAKKEFNEDIIVLFSDIIYDEIFLKKIINTKKKEILHWYVKKIGKKNINIDLIILYLKQTK